MRFKRLDLNLLVVLDVLLRERNVSRAAEHLSLSQPAMSAALRRLRSYFNDPILLAHGKRMIPTAHAQGLLPLVAKALADIDELISASTVFDPSVSQRTFRICASDYVTTVLLAPLFQELASMAPNVSIELSEPSVDAIERLERGEIEFMLAPEQFAARDLPTKFLFEDRHVIVGWRRNPVFRAPLTEEVFFAQSHVAVAVSRSQTFAEQELAALGRTRRIEITAHSFLAVPWLLPNTRRLAVMHERLARLMQKRLPLAIAPLPFRFPLMRETISYHSVRQMDGGAQWLLKQIEARAALERQRSIV